MNQELEDKPVIEFNKDEQRARYTQSVWRIRFRHLGNAHVDPTFWNADANPTFGKLNLDPALGNAHANPTS